MKKFNNVSRNVIGNFLKNARKKKNFSTGDLCRELQLHGVEMITKEINRIEKNEMSVKDFELIAMCLVLDINFE